MKKISKALLELNACVKAFQLARMDKQAIINSTYHHMCDCGVYMSYAGFNVRYHIVLSLFRLIDKATHNTISDLLDRTYVISFLRQYRHDKKHLQERYIDVDHMIDELIENIDDVRRCSVCGRLMQEGYCQDGGWKYYCSDECLHKDFTDEEWNEECDNNENSYWTQWY
jgi:hypothetical protein